MCTSVTNDKADNEMIPGAVHRSPGIYLTTEENLRLTDEGAVRAFIILNGVPYLKTNLLNLK